MQAITDIKTILYQTIHRNKKPVAQIADETGISSSYLYRAGLPVDQSGVKFPVEKLIPLMKSTNDYSLLEHISKICGFLLVRVPKVKPSKGTTIDIVDNYQESTTKALRALKEFFNSPDKDKYLAVDQALQEVMERSASAQKYCKKNFEGQFELEL
ncbi:MAG: hypothetical protein HF314_12185 [Ignavibacteria bacterium]|nr:hypothetical protein [Ignavibacteria bacterium]MCU7503830.1 hypothetical protein [Ignavibacteria bacterium]MCU7517156.1 hypothetical protein [Ignavibacteria bacterium]